MDNAALLEWVALRSRPVGDCRIWQNAVDKDGYALGQISKFVLGFLCRRQQRIGRKVCEAVHGPPPQAGMVAMHSCDTPGCVESQHLSWGLYRDNTQDAIRKRGGHWARKYSKEQWAEVLALRETQAFTLHEIAEAYAMPIGTVGRAPFHSA